MSVGPGPGKGKNPPPGVDTDERYGIVLSERYRIAELLGTGGMGRVYAAEHVLMRKKLAVKVLHKELSLVPEVVTRFKREAMAAANIEHPNVAAATDFGKLPDGSVFLVLEYIQGVALRETIETGPLPELRAVHIARQIASALASAHAMDIVHRDLKPENVMLVKKGGDPDFVKVLDFGIAKVPIQELSERGSLRPGQAITKVGMVFGTPEYMAPEQALGQSVDGRADLYSLGVILFEMLAGVRPFASSSQVGILGQQLSMPVPRVSERAPGIVVSDATEQLLQELLNKESSERPAFCRTVVEVLDGVLKASGRPPRATAGFRKEIGGSVIRRLLPGSKGRPARANIAPGIAGAALPPPSIPPRRVAPPPPSKRPPAPRGADEPLRAPPFAPKFAGDSSDAELEEPATIVMVQAEEPATIEIAVPDPLAQVATDDELALLSEDGNSSEIVRDAAPPSEPRNADSPSAAVEVPGPQSGAMRLLVRASNQLVALLPVWHRAVAWTDGARMGWPSGIRAALVGVPSTGLVIGAIASLLVAVAVVLLTVAMSFSDASEVAIAPTGSGPVIPSAAERDVPEPEPTPANARDERRESQVPASELEAAKQKGAAELEQLSKRYPDDTVVLLELAKAQRLEKRFAEVIVQLRRLLEADPKMSRDAEVATLLWQSAQKQESGEAAFELLEGPMATRGADILFDLSSTRGIRADVKARAEKFFASERFRNVASDGLKVAVALQGAKSCEAKRALLPEVKKSGDKRALKSLRQLELTTGCGVRGKSDCFPCLREGHALADAIAAIDGRTRQ